MQVGKELAVDEVAEVVAGQRLVVVELAVLALGRGPAFPAIGLVEDGGVFPARQRGLGGFHLLQVVEVLEEEKPGGLLGVVELGGASGFAAEDVINVFEGLLEHRGRVKAIYEYLLLYIFYPHRSSRFRNREGKPIMSLTRATDGPILRE